VLNSSVVMVADATLLVANVKITSAHMACPFVIHFRTYRKSHWFRWGLMFQGAISDAPGDDARR
jgi:hypothetical protein